MTDIPLIQCSDQDLEELKRLALACRAASDDDHLFGLAFDEYDEHANPDQVLVLFEKIDQLTGKVGNMVCAKRQMDEELEIARDDLVIFKGALSALGDAAKKLVVCARTTDGTAGPDQGIMDACAGVESVITLAGVARAMNEFERVTAERNALQLLLNERDEQLHNLEQSRRAEFDNGQAAESQLAALREELANHDSASLLMNAWVAEHKSQMPWDKAIELIAVVTKMPDAEKQRLLCLDDQYELMSQRLADAERRNAELEKDAARWNFFSSVANELQAFPHAWGKMTPEKMNHMCDEAMSAALNKPEEAKS